MKKIIKLLVLISFISFLVPLSTDVSIFHIYIWDLTTLMLIIVYTVFALKLKSTKALDSIDVAIVCLLVLLFIFTAFGEQNNNNLNKLLVFSNAAILAIVFRRIERRIDLTKVLIIFFIVCLISQTLTIIIQQVTFSNFGNFKAMFGYKMDVTSIDFSDPGAAIYPKGTMGQHNETAHYLVIPLLFIMSSDIRKNYFKNVKLLSVLIAFSLMALIMTFSKGNIVILLLFLTLSLILRRSKIISVKYFVVAILLIFGIVTLLSTKNIVSYYFYLFWDRVQILSNTLSSSDASDFRFTMIEGAIQYIGSHLYTGAGFANAGEIWTHTNVAVPLWWHYPPHNTYLIMMIDGGIYSFLVYLFITISPLRKWYKYFDSKKAFLMDPYVQMLLAFICFGFLYINPVLPELAPLHFSIIGLTLGKWDKYQLIRKRIRSIRTASVPPKPLVLIEQ